MHLLSSEAKKGAEHWPRSIFLHNNCFPSLAVLTEPEVHNLEFADSPSSELDGVGKQRQTDLNTPSSETSLTTHKSWESLGFKLN